jgi:LemA protein
MEIRMNVRRLVFLAPVAALALSGCGVNTIPAAEENAKAKWADVQNQYQRRADLIPNLVATVKGYATHEESTLEGVVQARAKATSITVSAEDLKDPEKVKQFQQAQDQLGASLTRTSSRCRASWRARRTASRWPAPIITRPCSNITR